jgi:phosphorylcholine metabolism protein LicD
LRTFTDILLDLSLNTAACKVCSLIITMLNIIYWMKKKETCAGNFYQKLPRMKDYKSLTMCAQYGIYRSDIKYDVMYITPFYKRVAIDAYCFFLRYRKLSIWDSKEYTNCFLEKKPNKFLLLHHLLKIQTFSPLISNSSEIKNDANNFLFELIDV